MSLSQVPVPKEHSLAVLGLEASAKVWAIKHARRYFSGISIVIHSEHQTLDSFVMVGEQVHEFDVGWSSSVHTNSSWSTALVQDI